MSAAQRLRQGNGGVVAAGRGAVRSVPLEAVGAGRRVAYGEAGRNEGSEAM
ncbi:hypothetical protein [Nonomuraea longicatena]|uniref:hypothetical protein n=1 Tax=Nonomuraea longicatena TaxID=83682 RepID=UPI0031E2FD88